MKKQTVLVARAVFPSVIDKLAAHFEVRSNQAGELWTQDQLAERMGDVDGLLCINHFITPKILAASPRLKIVANMAVGYNNFDVPAMTAAGVLATNTPDVLTDTTADLGFALLMSTARRMAEAERYLRDGKWQSWFYDQLTGSDVHGSTLGILGMGRIGQGIAKRGAQGFGMKVIYHNRSKLDAATEADCNATWVSKKDLFKQADHIVLVLPYSAESHHTVGAAELALMKPTANLINIARGGLIDEDALCDALEAGRIAGAGLDVFEGEPKVNPRLLQQQRVVLTPHIGSASVPTRLAMANLAADNLIAYLTEGRALTPLNPEVMKGGKPA